MSLSPNTWILGYCLRCPDGDTRVGHIQVLATLRKNDAGKLVVDRPAKELTDELGPSGKVFWPQKPAPLEDFTHSIVRFRCAAGPEYGDWDTTRDWLKVQQNHRGAWEVRRFEGYQLIDQDMDVQWRTEPRWIHSGTQGEKLFLRDRATSRLIGPWLVGKEIENQPGRRGLAPESSSSKVYSFPIRSLPADSLFYGYVTTYGGDRLHEFLLYCPDPSLGTTIDLAGPKELAGWLLGRVVEGAPRVVERLDAEEPGWRKNVRRELEARGNGDRQLHLDRWDRYGTILDDLVFDSGQTRLLLEHPNFQAILEDRLRTAVEEKTLERMAEVEERAIAKAIEIESEARKAAEESVNREEARIDRAKKEADEQVRLVNEDVAAAESKAKEARARLEAVEAKLREREKESAEHERAVAALSSHLDESRERLARDVAVYQAVLANGSTRALAETPAAAADRPIRPIGEPINSEYEFVFTRLGPLLATLRPGLGSWASFLHAAIVGARATLVPDPSWARAYADALGGTARLSFVHVNPVWLGFDDLWNGGLGRCWERAGRDPDAVELVLLRDFDRALPQCYARPLLDLIAGYADELPEPGSGPWPPNLRVIACPAAPEDSLPLTEEVVRHFAAIPPEPAASSRGAEPSAAREGHVPADVWAGWREATEAAMEHRAKLLVEGFGPLARSAANEEAAILRRLRALGVREREAVAGAREFRVDLPLEYLAASDDSSEEA